MKKTFQYISIITMIISILLMGIISYYRYTIPNNFLLTNGNTLKIDSMPEVTVSKNSDIYKFNQANKGVKNTSVDLSLFNLIPIKSVMIDYIEEKMVVPGGYPFGVKLFTQGVIVIGINSVETEFGEKNPAKKAGIKVGDVIIEIDGQKITSNEHIENILNYGSGKSINLNIMREGKIQKIKLQPEKSSVDGSYKGGIWVRDSSAGIGTVSFYDLDNGIFGGLGHPISDPDTGDVMPIMTGEVVDVRITDVIKGYSGIPGELKGNFISNNSIGNISLNDKTGVYGRLYEYDRSKKEISVGLKQDVKEGKATILTTLDNNIVEEFEIEIKKINFNNMNDVKNMVIQVTDKNLLEKSGGIVQGMSGSPILQNGKIVGAVTHVFVNDPTRGYGIFMENMYDKSRVLNVAID
ncbi:MAG: SpoIVB peptidase [Oscillospiraceae bacterium]|nr:SpoIVB peptidase [Oscillospiraceae bacterium]